MVESTVHTVVLHPPIRLQDLLIPRTFSCSVSHERRKPDPVSVSASYSSCWAARAVLARFGLSSSCSWRRLDRADGKCVRIMRLSPNAWDVVPLAESLQKLCQLPALSDHDAGKD